MRNNVLLKNVCSGFSSNGGSRPGSTSPPPSTHFTAPPFGLRRGRSFSLDEDPNGAKPPPPSSGGSLGRHLMVALSRPRSGRLFSRSGSMKGGSNCSSSLDINVVPEGKPTDTSNMMLKSFNEIRYQEIFLLNRFSMGSKTEPDNLLRPQVFFAVTFLNNSAKNKLY